MTPQAKDGLLAYAASKSSLHHPTLKPRQGVYVGAGGVANFHPNLAILEANQKTTPLKKQDK